MELKTSRYNILLQQDGKNYVFNQLTGALSELDDELFLRFQKNEIPDELSSEEKSFFVESHFLCDRDLQEGQIMLQRNRIRRYGNRYARLTIMPTLNCNFKCWYCYEGHVESKMDDEIIERVIAFAEKLISNNSLSQFELDWFGGEPLLYFDEVMYPVAKRIRLLCEQKGILFQHAITTNGYLISNDVIRKMKEIELSTFQITLDGSEEYHNKTRFTKEDKTTYPKIVENISTLCREIPNINMTVRINYSPKNLDAISQIARSFPQDVRGKLRINPQIIWQYKDGVNEITDTVFDQLKIFAEAGYNVENIYFPSSRGIGCYTENMLQYVVNYDGSLFKCTARDFSDKYSIGHLNESGEHISNPNFYNYYSSSYFENPTCLNCEILPSCTGMCIQKPVVHLGDIYFEVVNFVVKFFEVHVLNDR